MGKNQRGNRRFSEMNADVPRSITCPPATNSWPWEDVLSASCRKPPSLLDTCHDHLHAAGVTIGSPPPKSLPPWIADVNEVCPDDDAILRIQVPAADGANNNCQSDGFSIGNSEINVTSNDHGGHCKGAVDPRSLRIQALQIRDDRISQLRHPIIICEEAEDAGEVEDHIFYDDASSLAVPILDVAEEKKRPPLPDDDSF